MTDKTTPEPVADALPPLPASQAFSLTRSVYTADDMHVYASAALASRDAEIAKLKGWRDAIDEALVVAHIGVATEPYDDLNKLLQWHHDIWLDPAVSSDAAALVEQGRAEIAKLRQGEPVALPNCTVADVGFRWDGDKQEHIPQVLVSFTPVPANRPNDDKGWKDRDAFAGMLASPPPAQAAQAEPVAEAVMDLCQDHQGPVEALAFIPAGTKLYAAQPPREPVQPLSNEEIRSRIERECGPVQRVSDMLWAVEEVRRLLVVGTQLAQPKRST